MYAPRNALDEKSTDVGVGAVLPRDDTPRAMRVTSCGDCVAVFNVRSNAAAPLGIGPKLFQVTVVRGGGNGGVAQYEGSVGEENVGSVGDEENVGSTGK